MCRRTVLFFGGNGHCAMRLAAARTALAERLDGPWLRDVAYPGFEGRPRAATRDDFLAALAACCGDAPHDSLVMATGIGALLALSLRALNALPHPLILQGPVLWGLEQRLFPRLMKRAWVRDLLTRMMMRPRAQRAMVCRCFRKPLDAALRAEFFGGYARCAAFEDLFAWFTPSWLRVLEQRFAARPEALQGITIWAGGRDGVVGLADVRAAERALGVRWPLVEFPEWGHYPMIDVPGEWADALTDAVAAA